jgi:hypothetical protein
MKKIAMIVSMLCFGLISSNTMAVDGEEDNEEVVVEGAGAGDGAGGGARAGAGAGAVARARAVGIVARRMQDYEEGQVSQARANKFRPDNKRIINADGNVVEID